MLWPCRIDAASEVRQFRDLGDWHPPRVGPAPLRRAVGPRVVPQQGLRSLSSAAERDVLQMQGRAVPVAPPEGLQLLEGDGPRAIVPLVEEVPYVKVPGRRRSRV